MTARTIWSLSFLERLELQLLQEAGQRVWRVVGGAAGKEWSEELPHRPGTALWLPALPNPDVLWRISWRGMEELGVRWGEAFQLRGSFWLCPLLVQRGVVRVERVILGSLSWEPDIPKPLALVSAPLVSVPVQDKPRFALAAFLKLGWSASAGARISLVFPHDAEGQVGKLLERNGIREPVLVAWAQVEGTAVGSSSPPGGSGDLRSGLWCLSSLTPSSPSWPAS
jgi:hypothetical protein